MEKITSRKNRMIAELRELGRSAEVRREKGAFLCDSPKLLQEALLCGAEISSVFWKEGGAEPLPVSVQEQYLLPADLFEYASPMVSSPGPLFVCAMPHELSSVAPRNAIVLENVQDPGTVGTVIRTANALGIGAVLLVGACADLYHPKTVRATMGAIFRQRVEKHTVASLQRLLSAWKMPLAGAVLSERAENILQTDLTCCACAVGSEGSGLSRELIDLCSREVIIPMQPESESLNAAVAASIIMWEMRGRAI